MFNISIDRNIDAALQRQIDALSDANMQTALVAAGRAAGVAAESVVSPYPPPSGKPLPIYYTRTSIVTGKQFKSKFKSLAQQRYVLALAARGKIPYKRTGILGKSITSDISNLTSQSVTVSIGTNKGYAPFVIDKYRQSHYHMGNWTPLQTDIERGLPTISDAANRAFADTVRRLSQ